MALYYLDASALAKLYIREPGFETMRSLVDEGGSDSFIVQAISLAEIWSAVCRRAREGSISESGALLRTFAEDMRSFFIRQPIDDAVLNLACEIVERRPLKASDAIQLAGCLAIKAEAPIFTCADRRLLLAAQSEGLTAMDPTT